MTKDEAVRLVDQKAAEFAEHFDTVLILSSWNEDGATNISVAGRGNWYAQMGMAHDFIMRGEAQVSAQMEMEIDEGEDDDVSRG